MAQAKSTASNGSNNDCRSKSSSNNKAGGGSGTSSQLMLIELKQRILCALNKLADRDTQHIAVEGLERIAETLTPEGISLCLSCLYDTDSQQKSAVRKECVRMFGTLASLHDDLLSPHLSKIVINIVKRLRDPDSSIRDACVDAMGTLAAKVSVNSGAGNTSGTAFTGALGVFTKPLFDVLNEQSRSVQAGAAFCLAGVIDNLKDPPAGSLQRLCPHIIKLLNSSTFTAKAALLSVIASIVQARGSLSNQCLAMVMACVQECLKSSDWATRKAAAETLASMASSIGPSLGTFKTSVLEALETCRFDKVKPVRDVVIQTLQVWKGIPSSDSEQDTPNENGFMQSIECQSTMKKLEPLGDSVNALRHAAQTFSDDDLQDGGGFGFAYTRSGANKIHGDVQKKYAPFVDKRLNPQFSGKVEKNDPVKWQIDIALPRALAGTAQDAALDHDGLKPSSKEKMALQDHFGLARIADSQDLLNSYGRRAGEISGKHGMPLNMLEKHTSDDSAEMSSCKSQRLTVKPSSVVDSASQHEEADIGSWSIGAGVASSSSSSIGDGQAGTSESNSAFIKQQLFNIETQQATILELLQKLMNRSEVSLSKLEARVTGVESIVGNLVESLAGGNHIEGSGKPQNAMDNLDAKIWKKNETCGFAQERSLSSESLLPMRGGRSSPLRSSQVAAGITGLIGNRFGPAACPLSNNSFSDIQANSWRAHIDDNLQRRARSEPDSNLFLSKSLQERGLAASRLGEGPSARSVWQASKDEATLAAIRVAADEGRIKVLESSKLGNQTSGEPKPEGAIQKVGAQGKGPFWSLWARAVDFLSSGDVDSAYVEVLCAGDELLLVRLMSRTGPVLKQLTNGTILQLLKTIVQLILQQSFLDVILPWVQQVSDIVTSTGSDCLGFSLDAKRDLVASLEEVSMSNYPEKWIATMLHELAVQLATSWGLVM